MARPVTPRLLIGVLSATLLGGALQAHGGRCRFPELTPPPQSGPYYEFWRMHRHRANPTTPQLAQGDRTAFAASLRPHLLALVQTSRVEELVAESLLSLATICRGELRDDVFLQLTTHLRKPSPRIRQAALLGLGLAADPRAMDLLAAIAAATARGRRWLNSSSEIDKGLRIHACHGLGLLAHRSTSLRVRHRIHSALASQLESGDDGIRTAVVQALSWFRAPTTGPAAETRLTRTVLRTLNRHWDDPTCAETNSRFRVPLAIGRLLGRGETGYHRYYRQRFLAALASPRATPRCRAVAAHTLGRLVTSDDYAAGVALRSHATTGGWTRSRQFAILALGEIGGRDNELALIRLLYSQDRKVIEWAALSLGLLGRQQPTEARGLEALNALAARLPIGGRSVGTLAVAIGMVGGQRATTLLANIEPDEGPHDFDDALSIARQACVNHPSRGHSPRQYPGATEFFIGQLRSPASPIDTLTHTVREIAIHTWDTDLPREILMPHRVTKTPPSTRLRFAVDRLTDPSWSSFEPVHPPHRYRGPSSPVPPVPPGPKGPG